MERVSSAERLPRRGEIWWTHLPTDPPGKGRRPVIVVSLDARNQHPRATSVTIVPLSTSIQRESPLHLLLKMGETGLAAESVAQADSICTVLRTTLSPPNATQRILSNHRVCELAAMVKLAMGCVS